MPRKKNSKRRITVSRYKSTRETRNLARAARIILGPCTDILRNVLKIEMNKLDDIPESLISAAEIGDITKLYKCFYNVCFESIENNEDLWGKYPDPEDSSLLANIERIRWQRNKWYGHVYRHFMFDSEYEKLWNILFRAVKEIGDYLEIGDCYQIVLNELKNCDLGHDREITSILELIEQMQKESPLSKDEIDEILKRIGFWNREDKDTIELWQKNDSFFVLTKACEEVKRLTRCQNLVIVTGNSGSGKSAIIQHIALKYRNEGWVVKLVDKVQEISQLYNVFKEKAIFVLNDPIGKRFLDEMKYNLWEQHEDTLRICLVKNKILLSCRKYILNDDRVKGLLKESSGIININSDQFKLTDEEKKRIWSKYSKLPQEQCADILNIDEYFPLLCKLYYQCRRNQTERLRDFFTEPVDIVQNEIKSFQNSCKEKYCGLVLLALMNNVLNVHDFQECNTSQRKFNSAKELCGLPNETPLSAICDALETLNDYFVKKIGNTYYFYHDFVMDITTLVLGKYYPSIAIEYADASFLRKRVRVEGSYYQTDKFTIYVSNEHIEKLGRKLFSELFGECFFDIVLNPCLRIEKMARLFITELKNNPEKLDQLLEEKDIPTEEEDYNQPINLFLSKLSFLKLKNRISPLCALIAYCHTDLSLYCLRSLKGQNIDIKNSFLFSAVCCRGSLDLFHLFSDDIQEYLTEKWVFLSPIHVTSLFHNFEILNELIKLYVNVDLPDERFGMTPLMMAAVQNPNEFEMYAENEMNKMKNKKTIELLLLYGADIHIQAEQDYSVLYVACQNGNRKAVNLLLQKNADINLSARDRTTPLYIASQNGHKNIVEDLLNNGALVNLLDETGTSPLFKACQLGHESTVRLLILKEANLNLCDLNGNSPLYIASQNGCDSIVQILVSHGADVNLTDRHRVSPLYIASQNGHKNIVELLFNCDAKINYCEKSGRSPLFIACQQGHYSIVNFLLNKGADIDKCDAHGDSPLYTACQNRHYEIVELLLDKEADMYKCNVHGESPLFAACENGCKDIVELLLNKRADIDKCDAHGDSPLYTACQNGHCEIVELLLDKEADMYKCNVHGESPLFAACENECKDIVELLLNRGADIDKFDAHGDSPLYIACQNRHYEIVELLLDKNADMNKCNVHGKSPLFAACENGCKDIAELLLNKGADIDKCEEHGLSPLYIACQNGHCEIVELLLRSREDISLPEELRDSLIFVACEKGHTTIVKLLLTNNANINVCNENGESPLHVACRYGQNSVVQLLLTNNANINLCDKNGVSPLFVARQKRHKSTQKLLMDNGANRKLLYKKKK